MKWNSDAFESLYCNDPENDYALVLEIHVREELLATISKVRDGSIKATFFPISSPFGLPLEWLLERLDDARKTLSNPKTQ